MHRLSALSFCVLLAASPMLFSCAGSISGDSSGNGADDGASDGTESAFGQATVTSAMVIDLGEGGLLFVSEESGTYFPGLDHAEVIGIDGNTITAADLATGNKVSVTGDGIMLESWPGQYPGISRIEVIDEGSPEDADGYVELINEIYTEPDASAPPDSYIEYKTELYATSTGALRLGYAWSWEEDGETTSIAADSDSPVQIAKESLPTVKVEVPTEVTARFDRKAKAVSVTRFSEDAIAAEGNAAAETVAADAVVFTVEPGYRYAMDVMFDSGKVSGTVTYAFSVPETPA